MKDFLKILRYVVAYKKYAILNVVLNLLSTVFSLFSFTMTIPFLQILFGRDKEVYEKIPVTFDNLAHGLEQNFYYQLTVVKNSFGVGNALIFVGLILLGMTLMKTSFKYFANYFMTPIRNGVVRDFRNKIYKKLLGLHIGYYSDERKGDVISRMTNDVQDIEWSIMNSLSVLFRDPITIVIYLSSLIVISPRLTLFVVLLLPISAFIIGRVGKSLKKTSMSGQNKLGELMSMLEETLSGLRIIKAFNAEKTIRDRFIKENNTYTRIMNRLVRVRYLATPTSELLGTGVMIIIMWYGGSLVLNAEGSLSAEQFIAYLIIFSQIITPAKSFSYAIYNVRKGLASIERINKILDAKEKIQQKPDAISKNSFDSSILYKAVSFKYENEPVLKSVDLEIKKGKTIALVGQSGSGKSTLADLLPRFHDVVGGEINIDGIDIRNLKIHDLRGLMGIVNQEPILFNDTIHNNIAFGIDAAKEDVINAAKVANAHEFIIQTESGYETNIGDRGSKLSGGQKQRISIARAVLKNPPIMILDEATSALDTESEKVVQEALTNLMKERTSLIIAHRLSTIKHADEIIVMHEGEIIERGTHDELIELKGNYSKLYHLQTD